jgi:hypothetical protein
MNYIFQQYIYPTHALPKVMQDAMLDMNHKKNLPFPLIANCILSTASQAAQQHFDVEWNGQRIPGSMFFLTVAESGEGKTFADTRIRKAINDREGENLFAYQEAEKTYKKDYPLWESVKRGLDATLHRKIKSGKNYEAELEALRLHQEKEPKKPSLNRLTTADITPEKLQVNLSGNGKSLAVANDDGMIIVEKLFVPGASLLTSIWSGRGFSFDRKTTESGISRNARLTIHVAIQPVVMQNAMKRHGDKLVGSGLLPRFMISSPESMIGKRFDYGGEIGYGNQSFLGGLESFERLISEMLQLPEERDENGNIVRRLLHFSPDAANLLREIGNDIEAKQAPGQPYANIKPFASRSAENIVRLAGLFHFINGGEGDIPAEVVRQADTVQCWYANEVLRLFGTPPLPEHVVDANLLLLWLQNYFRQINGYPFRKNILYQRGPNSIRSKDRMNAALDYLVFQGKIWINKAGKALWVNPGYNLYSLHQGI